MTRTVTVVAAQFDLFSASATEIVEAMTLAQKVGQMIQPEIAYITPEEITEYGIGSVLNGVVAIPMAIARPHPRSGSPTPDHYEQPRLKLQPVA